MTVATAIRRHEYWGGLGDLVNHIFWLPCYQALDTLQPGERAKVVISSHNPHAKELFLWHPKRAQIDLENRGFHTSFRDPVYRRSVGLPEIHECDHGYPFSPVHFHPNPEDLPQLETIRARGKYLVFNPVAGETQKNVPLEVAENAARLASHYGFTLVLVGRNYAHDYKVPPPPGCAGRREFKLDAPVVDLVDKLSVPGVLELLRGAAGIFTAHSVSCMAGWHMNRPVFVLYDRFAKETYFTRKFEGYSFGAGRPENEHMEFSEYDPYRFEKWVSVR